MRFSIVLCRTDDWLKSADGQLENYPNITSSVIQSDVHYEKDTRYIFIVIFRGHSMIFDDSSFK